jgi:hypothetical protein
LFKAFVGTDVFAGVQRFVILSEAKNREQEFTGSDLTVYSRFLVEERVQENDGIECNREVDVNCARDRRQECKFLRLDKPLWIAQDASPGRRPATRAQEAHSGN